MFQPYVLSEPIYRRGPPWAAAATSFQAGTHAAHTTTKQRNASDPPMKGILHEDVTQHVIAPLGLIHSQCRPSEPMRTKSMFSSSTSDANHYVGRLSLTKAGVEGGSSGSPGVIGRKYPRTRRQRSSQNGNCACARKRSEQLDLPSPRQICCRARSIRALVSLLLLFFLFEIAVVYNDINVNGGKLGDCRLKTREI